MSAKIVVITGATRGLGRAMVPEFTRRGHTVVGCGRTPEAIAELTRSHTKAHSFESVDITSTSQLRDWTNRILATHGPPDLLLNNAAIINNTAALWEIPQDELDQLFDTNIKALVSVLHQLLPAMIERGSGVIVNFSSTWGRVPEAGVASYCASKWAVEGLTRSLAMELPQGLAAVPFNPGIIDTEMLRSCFGSDAGSYENAEAWAERSVPFLLQLGPEHNGQALTAPS